MQILDADDEVAVPSVIHVVTTGAFAGVERYVCNVAVETAARGWETTVVGGSPKPMGEALGTTVRWLPGATPPAALRSLVSASRQSICHAHMTIAEAVSLSARAAHRAPVVSTRHFAAPRGSSRAGRLLSSTISRSLAYEIAVSNYVARHLERPPNAIVANGVPPSPLLWRPESRVILVLQRLEPEKDTITALRAWRSSGLADDGWSLRVVGRGSEQAALKGWADLERVAGIEFVDWTSNVAGELAGAGVLLAPGPVDSFGLAVLEAMAAGVPVVACGSGGHLETVGLLAHAPLFPPGDFAAAAEALRSLAPDESRAAASRACRDLASTQFTVERHVDRLLQEYGAARSGPAARGRGSSPASVRRRLPPERIRVRQRLASTSALRELVVCSLEPWDDVWRRNQFFVDGLLRRHPTLQVLFVEPPTDVLFALWNRRVPHVPRIRALSSDRRLRALRPLKPLPRTLGGFTDRALQHQVLLAARTLGFSSPTLWVNDVTYAPLIARTGWPSVYDVTDDWLLAPFSPQEIDRLRRMDGLALARADEVTVCSPALAASRGDTRQVTLIPNGVDVEHFRRSRPRPADLPPAPAAVYVGTLHESRLDVDLIVRVAQEVEGLKVVLVGPNALTSESSRRLTSSPNVLLLGSRPYQAVPGYLQHADVVIVPHVVSGFTESLDPIKAYECQAIDTPTVATPVAGFRELRSDRIRTADADEFVGAIREVLGDPPRVRGTVAADIGWGSRAESFEAALLRARDRHRG